MTGWRVWIVGRGPKWRLISPWTAGLTDEWRKRTILPDSGVLDAHCFTHAHSAPYPGCVCGIYLLARAADIFDLLPYVSGRECAFTYGTGTGVLRRYDDLVSSVRAASYRVHAILTDDGAGLTHYGVPVYRGALTLENMREVERRQ